MIQLPSDIDKDFQFHFILLLHLHWLSSLLSNGSLLGRYLSFLCRMVISGDLLFHLITTIETSFLFINGSLDMHFVLELALYNQETGIFLL